MNNNNLYKVLVILVAFVLTACQSASATPTRSAAIDLFKDQAEFWITVWPPVGWTVGRGGTSDAPTVIVTNDWEGYSTTDIRAIGIVVSPLTDKGSSEQILQTVIKRLGTVLTEPAIKVALKENDGQSYASVEYHGKSVEKDLAPAYYFLTIISTDKRSVLVFSAVDPDQEEITRPAYQTTVDGIVLH